MTKSINSNCLNNFIIAVALLVAAGCGATAPEPAPAPPPPIDEDLLALSPDDVDAVLWVNMAQLRSSALFEAFHTLLGDEDIPFMQGGSEADTIDRADEILFAFASGKQTGVDQFLILLKGRFAGLEILENFVKDSKQADQAVSEEIGSFKAIRTPKYIIISLTDRTIAICTEPMALKVTGLGTGQGESLRNNDNFKDLDLDNSVAARLKFRRGLASPDFTKYGANEAPVDINSISAIDGSLFLDQGLKAQINVTTETLMDASELSRELEQIIRKLGKNMFVVLVGIDWIFDRISISSERTSVLIEVNLNLDDIEKLKHLAERLRKIRELTEAEDQQGKNPLQLPLPQRPQKQEDKQ